MRPVFLFNSPDGNPIKLRMSSNGVVIYEEYEDADMIIIKLYGHKDNIKVGYDILKSELKNKPYKLISYNFKNVLDDLVNRNIIKEYYYDYRLIEFYIEEECLAL